MLDVRAFTPWEFGGDGGGRLLPVEEFPPHAGVDRTDATVPRWNCGRSALRPKVETFSY